MTAQMPAYKLDESKEEVLFIMVTLKTDTQSFLARFPMLKGISIALLIQFVLIFLLTALFHFSSLSDSHMGLLSIMVVTISVLVGGMMAAKAVEARFLLNGLGVGIGCLIIVLLVSIIGGNSINLADLGIRTLYYLGAGTVGGMLGAIVSK
jgi:putative membrane protein (TIGR04086 family)